MGDYARYNLMLRIYKCSLYQEKKKAVHISSKTLPFTLD